MPSFGGPGALAAPTPLDVADRLPVIELAANIPVGIAPLDSGVEFELLVLLKQKKERQSVRKTTTKQKSKISMRTLNCLFD